MKILRKLFKKKPCEDIKDEESSYLEEFIDFLNKNPDQFNVIKEDIEKNNRIILNFKDKKTLYLSRNDCRYTDTFCHYFITACFFLEKTHYKFDGEKIFIEKDNQPTEFNFDFSSIEDWHKPKKATSYNQEINIDLTNVTITTYE